MCRIRDSIFTTMADALRKCHIGELIDTLCHKKTFESTVGFKNIEDLCLSESDKEVLSLRTEKSVEDFQTGNICLHHIKVLLKKYEFLQKKCSDPLQKHPNVKKTKALRTVSLQMCKSLLLKNIKVKPGQKLCTACRQSMPESQEMEVDSADTLFSISISKDSSAKEHDELKKVNDFFTHKFS